MMRGGGCRKRDPANERWEREMPAPLTHRIGMLCHDHHRDGGRHERNRREQSHAQITQTAESLENLREPQCDSVMAENDREVEQRQ